MLREIETETIKEVCAGRGKVIATGGGSVLKPENRMWLRANSVVIYISRPLSMLSVKTRPLSQGRAWKNSFTKGAGYTKKLRI